MESAKVETSMDTPCWKKKSEESGFFAEIKGNLEGFVNTPMEQHKICLKKSYMKVVDNIKIKTESLMQGPSKVASESDAGAKDVETPPSVQE